MEELLLSLRCFFQVSFFSLSLFFLNLLLLLWLLQTTFMFMCSLWPLVSALLTCNISIRAKNVHKLYLDITLLADFSTLAFLERPLFDTDYSHVNKIYNYYYFFLNNTNYLYLTFKSWNVFHCDFLFCLMQLLFNEVIFKICNDHIWVKYQSCRT